MPSTPAPLRPTGSAAHDQGDPAVVSVTPDHTQNIGQTLGQAFTAFPATTARIIVGPACAAVLAVAPRLLVFLELALADQRAGAQDPS